MATITASLVKQLRDKTGAGMGDCKKALVETDGDVDKAVDVLRAKGIKDSQAARSAAEGQVAFKASADGKGVAIVELRCETDFAARSENFTKLMGIVVDAVEKERPADAEAAQKIDAVAKEMQDAGAVTIRENIVLSHAEFKTLDGDGKIGTYVHHNGSVGVAVAVNAPAAVTGKEAFDALLRDLAMHITAHDPAPVAVSRDGIPEDLVKREKAVYQAQIDENEKDKAKPQNIKDKMIEGRLRKFYEDRALLEQKFVRDGEKTITQLLQATGKELGGELSIAWFVRKAVGE